MRLSGWALNLVTCGLLVEEFLLLGVLTYAWLRRRTTRD